MFIPCAVKAWPHFGRIDGDPIPINLLKNRIDTSITGMR